MKTPLLRRIDILMRTEPFVRSRHALMSSILLFELYIPISIVSSASLHLLFLLSAS